MPFGRISYASGSQSSCAASGTARAGSDTMVEHAAAALMALEPITLPRASCGITRFVSIYAPPKGCMRLRVCVRFITEKFRQHVAFRPRYGRGGSKTRSEDALTIGRITDHAFQQCVDQKTIPAESDRRKVYARNALLALKAAGIRPVRTQLPVR